MGRVLDSVRLGMHKSEMTRSTAESSNSTNLHTVGHAQTRRWVLAEQAFPFALPLVLNSFNKK